LFPFYRDALVWLRGTAEVADAMAEMKAENVRQSEVDVPGDSI
jgi:hypothetical protein